MLDPEMHDLEMTAEAVRQVRADALREELINNGGKSKYARGERQKIERAAREKADIEAYEREDKMLEEAEAAEAAKRKAAPPVPAYVRPPTYNRPVASTSKLPDAKVPYPYIDQEASRKLAADAAAKRAAASTANSPVKKPVIHHSPVKPVPARPVYGKTDWNALKSAPNTTGSGKGMYFIFSKLNRADCLGSF